MPRATKESGARYNAEVKELGKGHGLGSPHTRAVCACFLALAGLETTKPKEASSHECTHRAD